MKTRLIATAIAGTMTAVLFGGLTQHVDGPTSSKVLALNAAPAATASQTTKLLRMPPIVVVGKLETAAVAAAPAQTAPR